MIPSSFFSLEYVLLHCNRLSLRDQKCLYGVFDSIGEPNMDGIGINPPDWFILDNWVFENFILANEPFAKALQIFETWVAINNNSCGNIDSLLEIPITFDKRFQFYFLLQIFIY